MAEFLHYFPQYTLDDLRSGRLSWEDFGYLFSGMLDTVAPLATESVRERVGRMTVELSQRAMNKWKQKRRGW